MCDNGFIWNPSNCECESDKSCDIGEYLDYRKCVCRKRIISNLNEECDNKTIGIIPIDVPVDVNKKIAILVVCI